MVKFGIIVFFINELMVVVVVSVSIEVIGLFPRNVYEVSRTFERNREENQE